MLSFPLLTLYHNYSFELMCVANCSADTSVSLACSRFFRRSLYFASILIRLRSRFATLMRRAMYVICSCLTLEVHPSQTSSSWLPVGRLFVVSTRFPLARRMLGVHITCCDLTMCASRVNVSCVCLFDDASIGYSIYSSYSCHRE